MNCCNDAGDCTGGHGCVTRATRINTQADAPATGIHFAPGAIEHHVRPLLPGNAAQRRELGRWLLLLAVASGLCLLVGGVSGYVARAAFGA